MRQRYGVAMSANLTYTFVDLHDTDGCLSCITHYRDEKDAREEAENYQNRGYEHDPYAAFKERHRADNRWDLALAAERKRQVIEGDLPVEKTLSHSEVLNIYRSTRGESYR